MANYLKYIIAVLAALIIIWLSIDIKPIDKFANPAGFDAAAYASGLWDKQMPGIAASATELTTLINELRENPQRTYDRYGRRLGISKTLYFMVKGSGKVISVDDENIETEIEGGSKISIATGFIFGNAVRDGSGIVNIDDFLNMTDFNNVSVALNKLVKTKVVPGLLKMAEPGTIIDFSGALELIESDTGNAELRIIPVTATKKPAEHE